LKRDEAFDKLVAAVETAGTAQFDNVDDAFNVAAQALNYIMDNIEVQDGQESTDTD
jgi:hypothetical protein